MTTANLQLSGIPRLESARLLHFEGPLALLPGDGAASLASNSGSQATSSALFYNPFDDAAGLEEGFNSGGGGGWDDGDGDSDGTGGGSGGVSVSG